LVSTSRTRSLWPKAPKSDQRGFSTTASRSPIDQTQPNCSHCGCSRAKWPRPKAELRSGRISDNRPPFHRFAKKRS
jgi:hypothetical protein